MPLCWKPRLQRALGYAALALALLVGVRCSDSPFAPGQTVVGSLDVRGLLTVARSAPIPIDSFVVELRRVGDSTIAFRSAIRADSIGVSAGADSVVIDISVDLQTQTEEFFLYVAVVGNGIVWFEVRDMVTATAGGSTTTPPLTPTFVGPGADATGVIISFADTTIAGGDSILVTASVFEGQTEATAAPVSFTSSDTSLVPTPTQVDRNSALVIAPASTTDSVTITAVALTRDSSITDSGILRFFSPASQLIAVSGDGQDIFAGAAAPGPIVVQVLDAAGAPFTRGLPIAFAVASGPTGSAVSPDTVISDTLGFAQATVTAGGTLGTIQVTASAPGLTGSPITFTANVMVGVGTVAGVTVTPDSAVVLVIGDSVRFSATCQDSLGAGVQCGTVTWMSLTPAIASVDTGGVARSLAPGIADIVGASNGFADTSKFVVNGITSLSVSPADTIVTAVGDTVQLSVSGVLALGGTIPLTVDTVVWQSLSPAVALIDAVGSARIVGPGNGTIQASLGNASGTATLRVQQTPNSFAVLPDTALIGVGGQVSLNGQTLDRRGFQILGRALGWLSRNPSIATVDAAGRVTGVALGQVYVVGNDSTLTDSTLIDVVPAPPQVIQWGADSISVGRGATLQQALLLSVPAPPSGVTVDIVSSDTLILKPTTSVVTFSSGQTSRTVTFQGRAAGSVAVTATDRAAVFAPDTLAVGVLSTLEFRTVSSPTVRASNFSINSAESRRVLVFLSDPAPPAGLAVTIQAQNILVTTTIPSVAVIPGGQLSVEADLKGVGVGSTTLTPTAPGFVGLSSTVTTSLARFTISGSSRVGVGQLLNFSLGVPNRMDRGTAVNMATTNLGVGLVPDTVVVFTNAFNAGFAYSALQPGLDTITANRSGWVEARRALVVTSPLVRPNFVSTTAVGAPNVSWSITARDSVGSVHPRVDTLTVTLTSRDPLVMAVDVPTGLIQVNSSSAFVSGGLRPVGGGSTYLVASAAGHMSDSVLVTVQAPKLNLFSGTRTGTRQTTNGSVSLPFRLPSTGPSLTVQLSAIDTTIVAVPDSLVIPPNGISLGYTVSGVAPGTTGIIATATGFAPDTANITITTNRLRTNSLLTSYFITTGSDAFNFRTADQFLSTHPTLDTVTITLASTDPTVFTIDSTSVTVAAGGTISSTARIVLQGTGQAWLRWSAPNYQTDSLSITVNPSALNVLTQSPRRVGMGQYLSGNSVRVPSPNGLPDTVFATLTHIGPAFGTFPDTVPIRPGATSVAFRWDGIALGIDTVLAQATNFISDTAIMTVIRPALSVQNLPSSAVVDDSLFLRVFIADTLGSTHLTTDTLPILITSTDSLVLAVDSTSLWQIPANRSSITNIRLIVRGPGTAQIIVTAPNTTYRPDTTNIVVATAPTITLSPASVTLGTGQQFTSYRAFIPNGVVDTTKIALTVSDTAVAGFSTDTVRINPGGTNSPTFTVFAKNAVASVQLKGTAPGFTEGTSVLIVNTPQIFVSSTTTGLVGAGSRTFSVITRDEVGSTRAVRNPLAITLTSTNPSVLTMDSSAVTVLAARSSTNASWTPVSVGTAKIVATAPGYTPDTSNVITVQTPQVTLSGVPATLGVGQRVTNYRANFPFTVASTDTVIVTLTNSDSTVLAIPDTLTFTPGFSSRTFTAVGLAVGQAVVQATAPGFDPSNLGTTDVGTPTFLVNGSTSGTAGGIINMNARPLDQAGLIRVVDQALTVTFTVSDIAVANFGGQASIQVTVSAGSTVSGNVVLNLVTAGNVTVTATATGYGDGVRAITVNP